jgi:regulator of protease activity HflC (stomatin/prohibitin superfamily)
MTVNGALGILDGATPTLVWLLLAVVLLIWAVASVVRVVDSDERAVVIRLGRTCRVRGPGLVISMPGLERVQMVSMSPISIGVSLRGRTNEGIRVTLRLEARYQIADPVLAVRTHRYAAARLIDDLERITHHEVSNASLPQLLEDRELLATRLQVAMSAQALTGGVHVLDIEITTVEAELDRTVLRWMR